MTFDFMYANTGMKPDNQPPADRTVDMFRIELNDPAQSNVSSIWAQYSIKHTNL